MATSSVASASRAMMASASLRAAPWRHAMRSTLYARSPLTHRTSSSHLPTALVRVLGSSSAFTTSRTLFSTDAPDATSAASSSTKPAASAAAAANDVLERYRRQLEERAKKAGVSDIAALKETYADKIKEVRRRDAVLPKGATAGMKPAEAKKVVEAVEAVAQKMEEAEAVEDTPPASSSAAAPASTATSSSSSTTTTTTTPSSAPASTPAASSSATDARGVRPLSSLLDLDKVRTLPLEELTAIWRLRFAHDPLSLCAVIPAQTYAAMEAAARARPQFVLPLPHPEQGAEIHFLQWTFDDAAAGKASSSSSTVLFTQLAEYKLRGEFAQPHTTVTHYTDLAVDCGVVLMQGQVADGRGVTSDHAQWLVMCLQRFYGAWAIPGTAGAPPAGSSGGSSAADEGVHARRQLLQWFAAGDPQFSIEKLLEEVEKLA